MPIIHWTFINGLPAIFWYRWIAFDVYFQNLPGPQRPPLSNFFIQVARSLIFNKIQNLTYYSEIFKLGTTMFPKPITVITFTIKFTHDLSRSYQRSKWKIKRNNFFFTFHIFYTLQNHFRCTIKKFRIFRIFLFFNINFKKKI